MYVSTTNKVSYTLHPNTHILYKPSVARHRITFIPNSDIHMYQPQNTDLFRQLNLETYPSSSLIIRSNGLLGSALSLSPSSANNPFRALSDGLLAVAADAAGRRALWVKLSRKTKKRAHTYVILTTRGFGGIEGRLASTRTPWAPRAGRLLIIRFDRERIIRPWGAAGELANNPNSDY